MQRFFNEKILKVDKLTGGVTNIIYKIQCENNNTYIFREYGKKSSNFIDRDSDIYIMKYINNYNIGPKIINEYDIGRIESFEEGVVIEEFSKKQYEICNIIAQLHNIPIKKDIIHLYDRLDNWSKQINKPYYDKINKVMEYLNNDNFLNENVVGHGDLSIGNLLIENDKVKLIDFEYSCILPRGFDLANHLCEYNGTYNIKYPEKDKRKKLIEIYLNHYNIEYNDDYLKIVDKYAIVSNYYWACWGLIYDCDVHSGFDYKAYSNKRFNLFLELYNNIIDYS
tara:strand:+ start:535 stop:1377 length:843 start_codon:yes stop_codon:yes gene_type:complete